MSTRTVFEADSFRRALAVVKPAISSKSPLTMLTMVRVRLGGLDASNTDMQISAPVNGSGDAINIAVPADKLAAACNEVAGGDLVFEVDKRQCIIKGKKSRFKVPYLPGDDFPMMEEPEPETVFHSDDDFHKGLLAIAPFTAVQDIRYYLNGLFIDGTDGRLTLVGTDGHKCGTMDVGASPKSFSIILPRSTAETLGNASPGEMSVSRGMIVLESDSGRYVAKAIDGTFPNWRRIFPAKKAMTNQMVLNRADFKYTVNLTKLTRSSDKKRATRFSIRDGELHLLTVGFANEEIESQIPYVSYTGQDGDMGGFNGDLLDPIIDKVKGDEIRFWWGEKETALYTESDNFKAVVMPMRL